MGAFTKEARKKALGHPGTKAPKRANGHKPKNGATKAVPTPADPVVAKAHSGFISMKLRKEAAQAERAELELQARKGELVSYVEVK